MTAENFDPHREGVSFDLGALLTPTVRANASGSEARRHGRDQRSPASLALPDKVSLAVAIGEDVRLTPFQRLIGIALLLRFHNTATGRCDPSYASLGRVVGLKRRATIEAVHQLERFGWVKVVRTKGGRARNTFRFAHPETVSDTIRGNAPPCTRGEQDDSAEQCASMHLRGASTSTQTHEGNAGTNPRDLVLEKELDQVQSQPGRHRQRGSRLPTAWHPSPMDIEFAVSQGLAEPQVEREIGRFRDYWHSSTGRNAVKLDWSCAWRNWCRNTADRAAQLRPTRANTSRSLIAGALAATTSDGYHE
jgi:hypothetical protein